MTVEPRDGLEAAQLRVTEIGLVRKGELTRQEASRDRDGTTTSGAGSTPPPALPGANPRRWPPKRGSHIGNNAG
jgi:hypothetical protein